MCKLLYHFRLFYSVAVLASLAGCMKDSDADMAVFMSEIEISGKVYDFDSGAFSGVENMMVVLSSFESYFRLPEGMNIRYPEIRHILTMPESSVLKPYV